MWTAIVFSGLAALFLTMTVAALVCQRWVQRLLFEERKLAAGTVGLHVAALRIVYVRVLKRRTLNPIGSPASDPSPALAKEVPQYNPAL